MIKLGQAHDALHDAVAACGGKWRDVEFHGNCDVHEQMGTPRGSMVLLARARVMAHHAGVDLSNLRGKTVDEKAREVADRIEDQCIEQLGMSAWTMKPPPPVKTAHRKKAVRAKTKKRARARRA